MYFRVTAYYPKEDLSVIMDSNGMFNKLWELSSFLIQKGMKITEASNDEKFIDVNMTKAETDKERILLRAYCKGKAETLTYEYSGVSYMAVKVGDKVYIPDKSARA